MTAEEKETDKADELFLQLHIRLKALEALVTQVIGGGIAAAPNPSKASTEVFDRARAWSLGQIDTAVKSGRAVDVTMAELEVRAMLALLDKSSNHAKASLEALRDEVLAKAKAPSETKN